MDKKRNVFKERLIRQFNLKMVKDVIAELKQKELKDEGELKQGNHVNDQDEHQGSMSSEEQKAQDELMDAKRLGRFLFDARGIDKQLLGTYFGEKKTFN